MKKKLIILIIAMIIILPASVYAYGGINTNIVIGETNAATSSVVMTNSIVGTLQVLGTIVSVVAMIIIGIRYMISSVDQKAQLKGVMWYYIIGAILVFATSNVLGFVYDIIEDTGHSWKVTREEPTCTKNGSAYHECQDSWCDESYTTVIPALGHNYGGWTTKTEATCTAAAVEQHKCTRCNNTETRNSGSALGHSYGGWTTKTEATCTAAAVEQHKCTRCNNTETRNSGSALGHSYGSWTTKTAATCTAAKVEQHKCSRCNNTETRNSGSALGHSYGSWTTKTAATCTAAKVEQHKCSRCNNIETRNSGSPLNHDWYVPRQDDAVLASSATCSAKAKYYYECKNGCGVHDATFENGGVASHQYVIPANWNNSTWFLNNSDAYKKSDATCKSKAIFYKECTWCKNRNASQTFEYGSLGSHNYAKSGCDEKCTVCGEIK